MQGAIMSKPSPKKLLALRREAVMKMDALKGSGVMMQEAADEILLAYLRAIGEVHVAEAWQRALER
jgi:hypothetical protein